ncbi:unnamed protein product [Cuscuta epithymum]|uniref:Uncharacterized protein n=1 Tax=Cuscuta epithymum TaxID=186058 RepID=A0AAV0F0Q1_9ASTE|nr:unnamed protein product [Cuscuta epithymum]CAH9129104.1 unnamed protein product [Cuscuta epithymum]
MHADAVVEDSVDASSWPNVPDSEDQVTSPRVEDNAEGGWNGDGEKRGLQQGLGPKAIPSAVDEFLAIYLRPVDTIGVDYVLPARAHHIPDPHVKRRIDEMIVELLPIPKKRSPIGLIVKVVPVGLFTFPRRVSSYTRILSSHLFQVPKLCSSAISNSSQAYSVLLL